MKEPIEIISLGAGVQSSTMALMAAAGEITPMPICGAFSDTQWEPWQVMEWLRWLCGCELREIKPGRWATVPGVYQKGVLPFPIHCLTAGDIREQNINAQLRGKKENGERWASLPYFVRVDGQVAEGRVRRQCTSEYKIEVLERWMKSFLLGHIKGSRLPKTPQIIQWRGITTDEAARMKDSREAWFSVRYPLAMEKNMTRGDCLLWMQKHGYAKPPRSACIGCPFHSDSEWRDMRNNRPKDFQDAVEFDRAIRKAGGMRGDSFLHRSLKPLNEIDFDSEEERGQLNMFNNECEGMCGV